MVLAEAKLQNLVNARVLVVGDSMLDRYWIGDVNRISPEAPVPVVCVTDEQQRMGGAANVAINITAVGGKAVLLSIVGGDGAGKELESMLTEAKIESHIQFDSSIRTTVKIRLISRNQQLVRADFESTPSAQALEKSMQVFKASLNHIGVVLFSDYGKGGAHNFSQMISAAHAKELAIYIDPKGADYEAYRGATLITPNLSELQQVAGEVSELSDINVAAQSLMAKLDIQAFLITLSERGMLLCQRGVAPIHQVTRAREVYDVTGAGDTVIAMMALAHASGFTLSEAMVLANHAAGVVVSKMGTSTANIDEILTSMKRT